MYGKSAGGGETHPENTPCFVLCVNVCPAPTVKFAEFNCTVVAFPNRESNVTGCGAFGPSNCRHTYVIHSDGHCGGVMYPVLARE